MNTTPQPTPRAAGEAVKAFREPAAPAAHTVLPPSDQDFENQAALAALTPHAEELLALAQASKQILALVQLPAPAATDAQLLALNEGERYFSESPSKYPECGHGTQYHAGAPGVLAFARAALSLAGPSRRPQEDELNQVRQAIRDYHFALDTRQHGGLAANQALEAIQAALGFHWVAGQEFAARAATGSPA